MVSLPVTWVSRDPFGHIDASLTIYDINVSGSIVRIDAEYKRLGGLASKYVVVWQENTPRPLYNPVLVEIGTITPGRHVLILRLKKPLAEYPILAFSLGRLGKQLGTIDLRQHIVRVPRKYEVKPIVASSGNALVLGVKCTWYNRGVYPLPPTITAWYNITRADTGKWIRSVKVSLVGEGEKTEKIPVEPGNYRVSGSIMINGYMVSRVNQIVNVGAVKPIIPKPKPIQLPKPKPKPVPTPAPVVAEKKEEEEKKSLLPLVILWLLGGHH